LCDIKYKGKDVPVLHPLLYQLTFQNETIRTESKVSMYPATTSGFILGCILCELFQTGSGQPALVYIVPAMFVTVGTAVSLRYVFVSRHNIF
jgi:hypothetical protein